MDEQEIRASAQRVPGSAQKARLVADQVRGLPVEDALQRLQFMPQRAAKHVYKVVKSAAANAEENFALSTDELYIKRIEIDEGPTRKWRSFGARGRFKPMLKRSSHIRVVVADRYAEDEAEESEA